MRVFSLNSEIVSILLLILFFSNIHIKNGYKMSFDLFAGIGVHL